MKLTVLSHDLSSNAAMRAHRLARIAQTFAEVNLIGPVEKKGPWPAFPFEPWIHAVRKRRFPEFFDSWLELVEAADGGVLIAVKPQLASFGTALVAAERRDVPVVLDIDDLDIGLAPPSIWEANPSMVDLSRPGSAVYVSLLTKATGAASAVTVASTPLRDRFGGTVIPHGADTHHFDPALFPAEPARRDFGFSGPTVLFPGTPRQHKGLEELARAVAAIPGARLAVTCRPKDLAGDEWAEFDLLRIPMVPHSRMPAVFAAADVVAIPQPAGGPGAYQMPIKAYDAMAMGKPIVATAVSDLPEALAGCARIVAPGHIGELTAALAELLEHPHAAAEMGRRARARCVEHYSLAKIAERLEAVIEGV